MKWAESGNLKKIIKILKVLKEIIKNGLKSTGRVIK